MNSRKKELSNRFDVDLSPFRDFIRHMDTFFNESFKQMNSQFDLRPFWVEMYETDSDIIVEADLPGYKKDQIHLEIVDNRLIISIEDQSIIEQKDNQKNYYQKQHAFQRRERVVRLPLTIPEAETKAQFKNEKLRVIIPKNNSNRKFIDIQ